MTSEKHKNEAKAERKKRLLRAVTKIYNKERRKPIIVKSFSFFILGLFGAAFAPFYPWWMVIMIALIVGVISCKFSYLSLIVLSVFMTGAAAYQSPEFGLIFIIFSLMILIPSLFNWKFGFFVFLAIFLSRLGLLFVVPTIAVMFYSLFLGLAVGVVSCTFLTLLVTCANANIIGFFVGPMHTSTFIIFAKPIRDDFLPAHLGAAINSISYANGDIIMSVLHTNFGSSMIPFFQIIVWCFAFYLVSFLAKKRIKEPIRNWLVFSTLPAVMIMLSSLVSMLFLGYSIGTEVYVLMLGIITVFYATTASAAIIKESFNEYFMGQIGVSTVGTRISEIAEVGGATFETVGGLEDVKRDLEDSIMLPLSRPRIAEHFKISPPKGILLFGPPGCGKTLLMKALTNELNIEMIALNCSDLMSKWYGESEARISELFAIARERTPCIIFFDDLDAIAKRRDLYAADDVTPRLLNIILSELDGMDVTKGIILVGTTNKPELIDPALLRPGRFDKVIYVPPPDYRERTAILNIHLSGKPVLDVDMEEIAKRSERFSGADIANLVREAATIAMKRSIQKEEVSAISNSDFLQVLSHIRPSISISMKEEYERLKVEYERKMHELLRVEKRAVVGWEDVGGLKEIKEYIREYVELLVEKPELMEKFKLKTSRGILLFGPPGCGKTYVMRAVANELDIPIQIINGPELVSEIIGRNPSAIRDALYQARENAPSVIFFDDVDVLASKESLNNEAVKRAMSQFLMELNGTRPREKVVVVAATNRPHLLDSALLGRGRFDKMFYIPPPDLQARKDIFGILLKDIPKVGNIDIQFLASKTEAYSSADIASIVDEAKLLAIGTVSNKKKDYMESVGEYGVKMEHLLEALSKTNSSISPETLEWSKDFIKTYGLGDKGEKL